MAVHDDEVKAKVQNGPIVSIFSLLTILGLIAFVVSIFTGPAVFRIGSIVIAIISFFITGFAGSAAQEKVSQNEKQIEPEKPIEAKKNAPKPSIPVKIGEKPEENTKIGQVSMAEMAYQEVVNRRKPESTLFHIEYVDSMGEESSRDIEIQGFKVENDYLYINAYCYLAKDKRQFRADRLISISCEGHTIQNPQQFLWDMYTNSPLYKTQQALNEHTDEILALVFLARADGKMLKNEREIIGRYIDLVVPGINAEGVEKMLKSTVCELAEFNKILKQAKAWAPDSKKLVMDAASQIFALKKQSDSMEKGTFEKLKAALSGI
jgi:hypothetical protein